MDDSTRQQEIMREHTRHCKRENKRSRCRRSKVTYVFVVILICEIFFVRPNFVGTTRHQAQLNKDEPKSIPKKLRNESQQQLGQISPTSSAVNVSIAPLFYHISPGSTGSRTLYHASCSAGYPSVHHKSFCISRSRGIAGVDDDVVEGVRAHYKVYRLYEMAARCCSLWSKDKLKLEDEPDGVQETVLLKICSMPLDEWAISIQTHVTTVLQSGLVGLFDTPYPYLAPQVLDIAKQSRANIVIAMTQRDPEAWARSRIKHGLLLCREEYSYKGMGSSEFDVMGCISRAYESNNVKQVLHFWDVFKYRSHSNKLDPIFQQGMVRQMEFHQNKYSPLAEYTPDFFGIRSKQNLGDSKATMERIEEKDVLKDIRNILTRQSTSNGRGYKLSLTCRGRVNWEITNDMFIELYHLPKTCHTTQEGKRSERKDFEIIPLIPGF